MKKILFLFLIFILSNGIANAEELDSDSIFDLKQNAYALYNTNHINEAYDMLKKIPESSYDDETFLILANIEEDRGNLDNTVKYLNSAIEKNEKFYKAYYNLGLINMKKQLYNSAEKNFETAAKYNNKNPYVFYNLGCAQIALSNYSKAKKNFVKAIYLKNDEKDFYYNLAYVNKKLGNQKAAQKVIDFYNSTFIK